MRAVGIRLGLSLLAAVLLFASVPTFGLWPLMWVALVPQMHVALAVSTPKRAFRWGWLTGFVANAVGFYWMDGLLERFGHMSAVEALPIVGLLVGYQGLAFAFFSWGVRRARDRTKLPLALLAPLVMVTIELVMPQIFPYYLGISQAFVPAVIQIADLTGPLGVTALMAAFNGAALDAWIARGQGRGWRVAGRGLAIAGALVVADLGYGALRLHQVDAQRTAAAKVRTGIVQANVGIIEKWDPREFARLLALHQRESAELARAGAELMVWPESSYPYTLPRAPHALAQDFAIDDPAARAARFRHAAAVRRGHPVRRPGGHAPRTLPVQHRAHDGRRRAVHRQLRQGVPDDVRRVHPLLRPDPLVHEGRPRGVELQPGERSGRIFVGAGDAHLQARAAHLLRGHPARLRPPPGQARAQRLHQHHERRLVRSHRRAVPAPRPRGVPLGGAPPGDDPGRQHRRLRPHRRRRPRARGHGLRRPGRPSRRRRRRRCWWTWRCFRAAVSTATSATCSDSSASGRSSRS